MLVLLYVQSPVDVADLTVADVEDDGTEVKLTLGTEPIILPEPLAGLMRDLVATRHGHATIGRLGTEPWLFPGGRPCHPLGPASIRACTLCAGDDARDGTPVISGWQALRSIR